MMRLSAMSFWTQIFLLLSLLLPALILAAPAGNESLLESRANVRDVPGVGELKDRIRSRGVVARLPSVFYTNYPVNLNQAQNWARDEFDEEIGATQANWKYAVWGRLVDAEWFSNVRNDLQDQMKDAGYSENRIKHYHDIMAKNLCQAFGESAQGDVYVVVSDDVASDNNFDVNLAWGGWEYPALTRNKNVNRILRVDPSKCDPPREIWRKGQAKSRQEPKGKQGSTKPRKYL